MANNQGQTPKVATGGKPDSEKKETPQEKFIRLAPARVTLATKYMELVAATAEKGAYEYTKEQAEKIITHLEACLTRVKTAFKDGKNKSEKDFSL